MKLSTGSAAKLQNILAKRIGHKLSEEELERAYDALMDFAFALTDLDIAEVQEKIDLEYSNSAPSVANYNFGTVYC